VIAKDKDFPAIDPVSIIAMLPLYRKHENGDTITASCPSGTHIDNNPSWGISKITGQFHCFACGYNGNLFTLVKQLMGKSLYEFAGISNVLDYTFQLSNQKSRSIPSKEKSELVIEGDLVSPYSSLPAIRELENRSINSEFVENFNVTFAQNVKINETSFVNRLCFPIVEDGKTISIEGRAVEKNSQYKKVVYPKNSSVNTLFNIDSLDFSKPLYLVEGIMDTVKIWQSISKNVSCTYGNTLSKKQAELVAKIENLILVPDSDAGGETFIKEIEKIADYEYYIVLLPSGKDPDECTLSELKESIDNKKLSVLYYIDRSGLYEKRESVEW